MPNNEGTFRIAVTRLPSVTDRLDALIRKAEALGVPGPSYSLGEPYEVEVKRVRASSIESTVSRRRVIVRDLTVSGVSPQLPGGWRMAAVIDHTVDKHDLGWMVRRVPGMDEADLPAEYLTDDPQCDHCGTVRQRANTYAMVSESGEWKRVGSGCLADFLGRASPDQIVGYYEQADTVYSNLADEEKWVYDGDDAKGSTGFMLDNFMAYVAMVVRTDGAFVSKKQASEWDKAATADRALSEMFAHDGDEPTDDDREEAKRLIEWGLALAERGDDLSEYERNLAIVSSMKVVQWKHLGLAASLVLASGRTPEREQRKPSTHQGEVGKRLERKMTVVRRVNLEDNGWGSSYLHIFEDVDGNRYLWRTNTQALTEGLQYQVRGTVKEHSEYRGDPQTVLTRCKITCAKCGGENLTWSADPYIRGIRDIHAMICPTCGPIPAKEEG